MAIDSVRQGTVSSDLQALAYALLARDRKPLESLQTQRNTLIQRSSILGTLKTKLIALKGLADSLGGIGTLSPFAAKAASSSDAVIVAASATASAAAGTFALTVAALARRATHVTDRFEDAGTAIAGGGTGTFAFTLRIGETDYTGSVTVAAGDDDKTVLDNLATAVNTALGSKGSATRVQTETGKSRLSVASAETGTANKITFTDTDGLLARIGLVKASPTAATDTTGGYLYEDLGNHELDAKLMVDGLTYYRSSNTVSDLVTGVTFNLKAVSASQVDVKISADADFGLGKLKDFIAKYNDVIDYLAQNSNRDPKKGARGVLAGDSVFSDLATRLRLTLAQRVGSQPAGKVDTLAALGIVAGADGKLSIKNETELKDRLANDPGAVASLFNATDGIGSRLEAFVEGFTRTQGAIQASQNQISARVESLKRQIDRANETLLRKQRLLEDQLARSQALLQRLAAQQAQMSGIIGFLG